MDGNSVSAVIAMVRSRAVDWSALGEQNWFSYEYDEGMLITLRGAEPLRLLSSDGTEEWREDGKKSVRSIVRYTSSVK